jgi:hypothetical protein
VFREALTINTDTKYILRAVLGYNLVPHMKDTIGFLWFSSIKEQMLSSYTNCTFRCTLLMQPSQLYQIFVIMQPCQCTYKHSPKIQQLFKPLSFAACSNQSTSHLLAFFTTNDLLYIQSTFTRRTSGHCFGTYTAVKFSLFLNNHCISHHSVFSFPFSSLSFCSCVFVFRPFSFVSRVESKFVLKLDPASTVFLLHLHFSR